MNPSKTLSIALISFGIAFAFIGCKSTSVETKENEKVPVMIVKGMTSQQLIQLIGKPKKVRTVEDPSGKVEIWEYIHTEKVATRLAQTGQTLTPYINPITGQQTAVIDETLTTETVTTKETLEILLQEDRVTAWKQNKEVDNRYDN